MVVIARCQVADEQRRDQRGRERTEGDCAEARFLRQVVLDVEIDADEAAVAPLAVVDRRVSGEKVAVVVALEVGIDVGLARGDALQPVRVRLGIERLERLHVRRCTQLARRLQVVRGSRVDHEEALAVALDHRVDVEDRRGRRSGSGPAARPRARTARESSSPDRGAGGAGRHRRRSPRAGDLPDVGAQHLQPLLLRQPLRNRDDGAQHAAAARKTIQKVRGMNLRRSRRIRLLHRRRWSAGQNLRAP